MNQKPSDVTILTVARFILLALIILFLLTGIVQAAMFVMQDAGAQELVQRFGYFGVLVVAFIAGLNAIVPVPAGSFVPIFTAAGLWMPLIITSLVIGTMLADLLAFYLGMKGREIAVSRYPRIKRLTEWIQDGKSRYIVPVVFLHATISPLPNEVLLVPLALAGVRMRTLIIPLLLGTIIYQSAFAFGVQNLFIYFVG